MEVVKISAVALIGMLTALQLRQEKPEYGVYIGLAAGLCILLYAGQLFVRLSGQLGQLRELFAGQEPYLSVLLRMLGITCLCESSAAFCRDAGFGGLAGQVELFGKLAVMLCGMPVLLAVLDAVGRLGV